MNAPTPSYRNTGYTVPETLLFPRSPMRQEDFESVDISIDLTGTLKDFEGKPILVNKGDTVKAKFNLRTPSQVDGVAVYCVKPQALPSTSWETPKIIVNVLHEGDSEDSKREFVFEGLPISQNLTNCFSFANLPILSPICNVTVEISFNCDTYVSSILCVNDGVNYKARQLKYVTEDFRKMLNGNIIPYDFELVSTLPNGGEPVPCHKFPIKMLIDGKLEGDKLELPLSNEALLAFKRVAYGDLSAIVDVSSSLDRLVLGDGEKGPHKIPAGVLREIGIASVFISIGQVIGSSTLIELATSQLLAKNIFDCCSDVISWVLANGAPSIGLELYERIKTNPNILNNFELKEPLLQVLMEE